MLKRKLPSKATLLDILVLLILTAVTSRYLPIDLLLTNTVTVGGDTPAHNYLASHLRQSLLEQGKVVSWAPGWWCGFPMFQFYFPLPYILIALLGLLAPHNIAFKLVSVLGVYSLPFAAYAAARMFRLPRPTPILLAIASHLFLFVDAHAMWGANIYSTLAGMSANALGFALMLPTMAIWWNDARRGRPSLAAILTFALLLLTHFFTSLMTALALIALPCFMQRGQRKPAFRALGINAVASVLLTAWWLFPLLEKHAYSITYGSNWHVSLLSSLPTYIWFVMPLSVASLFLALCKRHTVAALLLWFSICAVLLFHWGNTISGVFVNIRLWPFVLFGLLATAVVALGHVLHERPGGTPVVAALMLASLLFITSSQHPGRNNPPPIRTWAIQNYGGLEHSQGYEAFKNLVMPLNDTPGRLANDATPQNDAMGSPRIFELVPHLINKNIIEGGIVNSSPMAYHAFYARCEASSRCSGYPAMMTPTHFDMQRATAHLELLNTKHFIARGRFTKAALQASPQWDWKDSAGPWSLFELNTHDGSHVVIPPYQPMTVQTDRPEAMSLEWLYCDALLQQPVIFVPPTDPTTGPEGMVMSESEFLRLSGTLSRNGDINTWLHAGPFTENSLPESLDGSGLDPISGDTTAGCDWTPLLTQSPIYPGKTYRTPENIETLCFANIFSPAARTAQLQSAHDDGLKLWLNGACIKDSRERSDTFSTLTVALRQGRNRLLVQSSQKSYEQYFHIRLTDTNGTPYSDIAFSESREPVAIPEWALSPILSRGVGPTDEKIEANGSKLRFRTDSIGLPHLIKISYYPNWKVTGAEKIYRVSPSFMLIYPTDEEVTLYYGSTTMDTVGRSVSALSAFGLCLAAIVMRTRRRS
jgi:hypothetical protein